MLLIIALINFDRLNKIRVKSKISRNEKKGHGGKHTRPKKSGPALAVLPDQRRRPWDENGLNLALSETLKTGFVATRPSYSTTRPLQLLCLVHDPFYNDIYVTKIYCLNVKKCMILCQCSVLKRKES